MWNKNSACNVLSKHVDIELLEPNVFINTNFNTVIRGTVHLKSLKNILVKQLEIIFEGTVKYEWVEENKPKKYEKSTVYNQVELANNSLVNNDLKKYLFELPLPTDIPETVQSSSQIKVNYKLKINLISDSVHESLKKDIKLIRLPDLDDCFSDSCKNRYSNWCQYQITLDKRTKLIGSKLPIHFKIIPTVRNLKIKQIYLQLIEKSTVISNHSQFKSQQSQYIYPANNSQLKLPIRPLTTSWESTCIYQLPSQTQHSTHSYEQFNISHTLLVSIVVYVPISTGHNTYGQSRYQTRTITFQSDLDLLSNQLSDQQLLTKLPIYRSNIPISIEEFEKLNHHGYISLPPSYDEAINTC